MGYHFIDTYCHFDFPPFTGDGSASIQHAMEVGVQSTIVPATRAANFPRILALAENYPPLFAALGLHPIIIEQRSDDYLNQLQQELDKCPRKLVALGEIGLDLCRDDPQLDKQEWVLKTQLKLAKRCKLPVILHSRRAHNKLTMHLKHHALPRTSVVHGFSGSVQRAGHFVQLGYKTGMGGTITYPHTSKTRKAMAQLPLGPLLPGADAPGMPLNGFQGQPNRPEQAVRVFDVLYDLRPEPANVIADALYRNATALFSVWLDDISGRQVCALRRSDK